MISTSRISLLFLVLVSCKESPLSAQQNENRVGGRCEGCEAIYENPAPFDQLSHEIKLDGFDTQNQKIHISGTVYKADGRTPAPGIILYVYHTDSKGIYPKKGNETGWARRHGYLRGWLKTDAQARYLIKTIRPASYPDSRIEAHIHCIVKEPSMNEYYIHDFLFEDDPYLKEDEKSNPNKPGGNGVLTLRKENQAFFATRDIYLGRHVANYPSQ